MGVLEAAGWERVSLPGLRRVYYVNAAKRMAQSAPPYLDVLGLDETAFRSTTREAVFRAYRASLPGAAPEDAALLTEAYTVLKDAAPRAAYEQCKFFC